MGWIWSGSIMGWRCGTPGKDIRPVEVLWDGDGVPPTKNMGPVEVLWDLDGVPPPPPTCGLTNKLKILPSLILRMRAITNITSNKYGHSNDTYIQRIINDHVCSTRELMFSVVFVSSQGQTNPSKGPDEGSVKKEAPPLEHHARRTRKRSSQKGPLQERPEEESVRKEAQTPPEKDHAERTNQEGGHSPPPPIWLGPV